ncbi:hypothetical protein [Serratia sp. UGAL515B_01]|uniref:hypothetical protein n=1 Tax=Serratia sp. UGAL515B_01 TaxID=2986763 RepID=UPI002953A6CB|nr:hypothetical protein [Serratia sp. UGAL515B_01]WON76932.1 hypothetical protein OK023_17425 [Serratia sp. UGAL515B_01]
MNIKISFINCLFISISYIFLTPVTQASSTLPRQLYGITTEPADVFMKSKQNPTDFYSNQRVKELSKENIWKLKEKKHKPYYKEKRNLVTDEIEKIEQGLVLE